MTTKDLAEAALPYARHALKDARPAIVDAVGRAGWVALWPAWAIVTGPLLPVLVRIAVELAVGLAAPQLIPVLEVLNVLSAYISDRYLTEANRAFLVDLGWLLKTPRSQMLGAVQSTLAAPPADLRGADA